MKSFLRRPLFAFTLGAAITAAALLGHAAYATDGAINACFKPSNGTLYLLGEGSSRTTCQPGDVPISWNAAGLQGLPGEQGPQGPQGEPGADGEDGQDGQDGQDGVDGRSVTSRQLPAGDPNCPNGGSEFTSASGVTYACNGADGQDGEDGEDGNFSGTTTSPNGQFRLILDNTGIYLQGPNGRVEIFGPGVNIAAGASLQLSAGVSTIINGGGGVNVNGGIVTLNGGANCRFAARVADGVAVDPASGIGAITQGSNTVCIGG